jgi:polyisoprenoid-binding protein YceI
MIKTPFLFSFLLANAALFAQTWTLDKGHSRVGFTVNHHMISEVDGSFKVYDAKITATKEDFSDAVFEFSTETASFNTENDFRDKDLKSANYFDVEKFPKMSFKSTSFKRIMGNKWKLVGDLTIKDKTLPVTLDVVLGGPEFNERAKKPEIGIKATGKINRLDFGIGVNLPEMMVSNEVELRVLGEFKKD